MREKQHMIRKVLIAAVAIGVTVAVAQEDPAVERGKLMGQNDKHARTLSRMLRGAVPYDAAAVQAAFDNWATTAEKLPELFPETAKTGGENRASPKIWENWPDFEAKIAAFAKAVADNKEQAATGVDGLKPALIAVNDTCNDCHESYRLSKD